MARGEFVFGPRLPAQQPVHGGIKVILVHRIPPAQHAERTGGSLLVQTARRGELGSRVENARHDEGAYQIAFRRSRARQVGFEADAAHSAKRRGDVAVGQGALDLQGIGERDQGLSFEDAAEGIDLSGGPVGEIREGALDDFLAHPRGLAEEHGGRGVAIGDDVDVHGQSRFTEYSNSSGQSSIYMGTLRRKKFEPKTIKEKSLTAKIGAEFRGTSV